ncbi:rhodanese-like domain-containing protein [Thermodesulfobacteriota bacterium]
MLSFELYLHKMRVSQKLCNTIINNLKEEKYKKKNDIYFLKPLFIFFSFFAPLLLFTHTVSYGSDWAFSDTVSIDFMMKITDSSSNEDAVIIDSRPSDQFNKGHIPGSINIPYMSLGRLSDRLPKDKNKLIIFY